MQRAKEYNTALYLCFVDISKAYDSVNRNALWKMLRRSYNLPVKIINILKAFHDGTQGVVRFEGNISNEFSIRTGVKQGDILSLLPFNLYLNAITNSVSETHKHIGAQVMYNLNAPLMNSKDNMGRCTRVQNLLYADDMVLISTNYDDLNCLMETINNRLEMFGLKINIEKKMMILPKQKILQKITPNHNLLEKIEEVKLFKYLGVFLTNEVSLDTEVDARVKKASMAFGCLNKLVWYQPAIKYSTKCRLFKAVILPVLLYGSESWAPLNHHFQRLNTFVNQCLRTILGLSLFDKIRNWNKKPCKHWTHRNLTTA